MFGYSRTVHTSIRKLHELHPDSPLAENQVEQVVVDTFPKAAIP